MGNGTATFPTCFRMGTARRPRLWNTQGGNDMSSESRMRLILETEATDGSGAASFDILADDAELRELLDRFLLNGVDLKMLLREYRPPTFALEGMVVLRLQHALEFRIAHGLALDA